MAAFRATLEDAIEADVLLHVRDVSHGDSEAQAVDVETILGELGIPAKDSRRVIEVWNKIDLLPDAERERLWALAVLKPAEARPALVSAVTGEGIEALLERIENRVAADHVTLTLEIDAADGEGLAWLYRQGEILARQDDETGHIALRLRLIPQRRGRVEARFPQARLAD